MAFCRKLYSEVDTLSWIASLESKLFAAVAACVPQEGTRFIRQDSSTTGTVVYDELLMDRLILDMCNTVYEIAEKAGLSESVAQERCRKIRAYLPEGNLQ